MARMWEQNEELDEEEELVSTEHRDADVPLVDDEANEQLQVTTDDPREVLEDLGEDVSSSPAQRGHVADGED